MSVISEDVRAIRWLHNQKILMCFRIEFCLRHTNRCFLSTQNHTFSFKTLSNESTWLLSTVKGRARIRNYVWNCFACRPCFQLRHESSQQALEKTLIFVIIFRFCWSGKFVHLPANQMHSVGKLSVFLKIFKLSSGDTCSVLILWAFPQFMGGTVTVKYPAMNRGSN